MKHIKKKVIDYGTVHEFWAFGSDLYLTAEFVTSGIDYHRGLVLHLWWRNRGVHIDISRRPSIKFDRTGMWGSL